MLYIEIKINKLKQNHELISQNIIYFTHTNLGLIVGKVSTYHFILTPKHALIPDEFCFDLGKAAMGGI